jgi:hypothetical protein
MHDVFLKQDKSLAIFINWEEESLPIKNKGRREIAHQHRHHPSATPTSSKSNHLGRPRHNNLMKTNIGPCQKTDDSSYNWQSDSR